MSERLTRLPRGATEGQRVAFACAFNATLDKLGVEPGQEFTLATANGQTSIYDVAASDATSLGPFARDSDTSRKAALANYPRSGTQRHRILEYVIGMGDYGATRDGIAMVLGLGPQSVGPRVLELIEGGWLHESAQLRPTRNQNEAVVLLYTGKPPSENP